MRRVLLLPFLIGGIIAGCSAAKLLGAGETCFQSTDCQAGLACVPVPNATVRKCSSDLSGIVGLAEAGSDATAGDAAPMMDGNVPDGQPPPDSGPPADSGPPPDSGPPADSGSD